MLNTKPGQTSMQLPPPAESAVYVAAPPVPEDIAALRRHPRFADASNHAAAGIAGHYEGSWALNRLLGDRGRALLGIAILHMHYNEAGRGGLTATRLKEHCVKYGVCSPGRVTAMLGALRLFGFLVEVRARDRRVRRLRPTARFLAVHRERRRCFFEALAMIGPEGSRAVENNSNPAFEAAHVGALVRMFVEGMRLLDYTPELESVSGRDAGVLILLALAVAARRQGGDLSAPLDITISELAKRYSVSRGHVLSVLRLAEEQGMVARVGARGEGIAVSASLLDAVDRFVGASLLLHLGAIREALAKMDAGQPPRTGEGASG